jgi:non-canonical (house-cleaning) NTP pyrophosphatase
MDMQTVTLLVSLAALAISLLALTTAARASRRRDDSASRTLPSGAVLNPGVSSAPPVVHSAPSAGTATSNSTFEVPADVVELVRRGEKIQAIKALRDAHPGLGLAEAKRAVDALSQL